MQGFLSADALRRWQVVGGSLGWEPTKTWSAESRRLLAALAPPFLPEDEIILFEAPFWRTDNPFVVEVMEISSKGQMLKTGFFVATDSRLVIGNGKQQTAFQIPYEEIKALADDGQTFTVFLVSGGELIIKLRIPKVGGWGAAFRAQFASPAAEMYIQKSRIEQVLTLRANLRSFLNEIANENKLRRRE